MVTKDPGTDDFDEWLDQLTEKFENDMDYHNFQKHLWHCKVKHQLAFETM